MLEIARQKCVTPAPQLEDEFESDLVTLRMLPSDIKVCLR